MLGTAARLAAETALSADLIREAKVNFTVIGGTAFDRWLARELRTIGAALAHPVPQNLVDLIEGHRKVTR